MGISRIGTLSAKTGWKARLTSPPVSPSSVPKSYWIQLLQLRRSFRSAGGLGHSSPELGEVVQGLGVKLRVPRPRRESRRRAVRRQNRILGSGSGSCEAIPLPDIGLCQSAGLINGRLLNDLIDDLEGLSRLVCLSKQVACPSIACSLRLVSAGVLVSIAATSSNPVLAPARLSEASSTRARPILPSILVSVHGA